MPDHSAAQPDPWSTPTLACDVVMKGGITSGVIYPQAVAELARTYRLASVGGASAGAIAAAAAAAAELGRAAGAFAELDRMPQDLAATGPDGRSALATLFQPTDTARPLFRLLSAAESKRGTALVGAVLVSLLRGYGHLALLGALPGLVLVVLGLFGSGPAVVAGVVGGVLIALAGAAVGILAGARQTFVRMSADGFGMCTGMPGVGAGDAPALTPWLHGRIESLANHPEGAAPVTFGELDAHGVTLRVMTTNLTRHLPMAMPWRSREYFFDPTLMRRLFPEEVVAWMESHPPRPPEAPAEAFDTGVLHGLAARRGLLPWPDAHDLPIVVAARMSLSFPGLITAVRLEAVDYGQPANRQGRDAIGQWRRMHPEGSVEQAIAALTGPSFSPVWFTDGGLCSNLPVHFFDSPLPKRPTFAFNLGPFPAGQEKSADQALNSYLPRSNQGGMMRPWHRLPTGGIGSWGSFAMLMLHTARSWVDGEQLIMPGYRDRIVTVFHDDVEGGMNLSMPAEVVADLSLRGKLGAAKLVDAFAGPQPGVVPAAGWDNHRWIRFRTASAGLTGWLGRFEEGYRDAGSGGTGYPDLAGPGARAPLPSYRPSAQDRALINERTAQVLDLARDLTQDDAMVAGAPRPRPQLRLVPDDGTAAGRAVVQNQSAL